MKTSSYANQRTGNISMMTAACGIAVANVYLCQPLLPAISASFSITSEQAGRVATAAQIGYALGILLVVPLADRVSVTKLIRVLLALSAFFLLSAAAAPNIEILTLASLAITVATVIPQILIPIAVSTSSPEKAGSVVGTLQSGLIAGILLSRTFSGLIAQYSGSWRFSYVAAAACTVVLLLTLPRALPKRELPPVNISYFALIGSLPGLVSKWTHLRLSASLGALVFGAFSAFWATLAFHLAEQPFGYGSAEAGLFGLWGAAGALIAPLFGKIADRHGPSILNVISITAAALAFACFAGYGNIYVAAIVIGVNFLDFANQAGQIANQTRIFKLDPTARARLNTVYMVATFGGGAVGSTLGSYAWSKHQWSGVWMTGFALIGGAAFLLFIWACIERLARE